MLHNLRFDGEPDELKGSRPVLGGGKSGDNIKGLPIAISGDQPAHGADTLCPDADL